MVSRRATAHRWLQDVRRRSCVRPRRSATSPRASVRPHAVSVGEVCARGPSAISRRTRRAPTKRSMCVASSRATPRTAPPSSTDLRCPPRRFFFLVISSSFRPLGVRARRDDSARMFSVESGAHQLGRHAALDLWDPHVNTCVDCANLATTSYRVLRGGGFGNDATGLLSSNRSYAAKPERLNNVGARCARSP